MKVWLCLFMIFIFFGSLSGQYLYWRSPQLLCDTVGNNKNPSFVRFEEWAPYSLILLWERNFGTQSLIYLKDFSVPDSELVVNPGNPGEFSREPVGALLDNGILIVWQSNQNGNFELYSKIYENGQFRDYQQITNESGDDQHPYLYKNHLIWERDGNIYYRNYSYADSTWSDEELVDSNGCGYPKIFAEEHPLPQYRLIKVIYQKQMTLSEFHIYSREKNYQGWTPTSCLFSDGDNRFPSFVDRGGYVPGITLWQHYNSNNWDIIGYHDWVSDTTRLTFTEFDEIRPVGVGILSDVPEPFFAYTLADSNNLEIYFCRYFSWVGDTQNISQYPGIDQNPVFSDSDNNYFIWLAWERFVNGQWQIWGSFTESYTEIYDNNQAYFTTFYLGQNFPNPFNPATTIRYTLPKSEFVTLKVYDILGREVATLVNERQMTGSYSVRFDASQISSGLYFYKITAGSFSKTQKMVVMK